MANIFQDKIVKYLTLGLALAVVGMLLQSLFSGSQSLPGSQLITGALQETLPKVPSVAVDPKNLGNLKVENLKPFEVVNFPTRIGRDNPFEPYPLVEEVIATSTATTTAAISTSTAANPTTSTTTSTRQ